MQITAEVFGAGGFGGGNTGLRASVPGKNMSLCVAGVQSFRLGADGFMQPQSANTHVGLPNPDTRTTRSKGIYRLTGEEHVGGACGFTVSRAVQISPPPSVNGGGPISPRAPVLNPEPSTRSSSTVPVERGVNMARVMPGGRLVSSEQALNLNIGGLIKSAVKTAGSVVKGIIPGPIDDIIIDRLTQGGGAQPQRLVASAPCATGYHKDAQGKCVRSGVIGMGQRVFPGGQTGTQADIYGEAVLGRYGAALVPAEEAVLVRRCPPGSVLGRDNLCYDHLPKSDRKWRPGTKPLLTGGDMRTLRRARSLENRLKRHGLVPPKKKKSARKRLTSGS